MKLNFRWFNKMNKSQKNGYNMWHDIEYILRQHKNIGMMPQAQVYDEWEYACELSRHIKNGDIKELKPKGLFHTKYCPYDNSKLIGNVYEYGTYQWNVILLKCPLCNYEYAFKN